MNLHRRQSMLLTASLCILVSACEPPLDGRGELTAAPGSLAQALSGPAPLLTAVSPPIGPTTGGIVVTLSGKNFRPSLDVSIGGLPCTGVRVLSSTQVAVTLPASPGSFGLTPVTVSQPDGKSVTRGDLFYYSADTIDWLPAYHYADEVSVRSFLLRDLNKDGNIDAVATDNVHANVVVLLGKGDGFFQRPQLTPVVSAPDSLVAADFNGDGQLDLVVEGERTPDFSVLLGRGDGTFVVSKAAGIAADAHGLAAGDLNGNYDSPYIGWGADACRSSNHGHRNRSDRSDRSET